MGLGYDLNVILHKVAQNSPKYHILLKTMSNCLDLVRLLMLKLKMNILSCSISIITCNCTFNGANGKQNESVFR